MSATRPKPSANRPTALTPEVFDAIVTALQAGNYIDDAAAYAGVHQRLVFTWLEKGRNADEADEQGLPLTPNERLYMHFLHAVETARSQAVVRNVAIIQQAAQTQWQAAAWFLERTNPRKWGRHETVEITGEDGGPIRVEQSAKSTLADKFAAVEAVARQIVDTVATDDDDTVTEEPPALKAAT